MSEYVSLETIIEDPITAIKTELESMGLFDRVDEGDNVYEGSGLWAQVVPGVDRITLEANQQLHHRFEVYVNILQAETGAALPSLREASEQAFDQLLQDTSHNNTCWKCLPVNWRPGLYARGEYTFTGVQTTWAAENFQTFPLPSDTTTEYSTLSSLVETVVSEFKDEISLVAGVDVLSEANKAYDHPGAFAWVIPGESSIESSHARRLRHDLTIYQNVMTLSGEKTLAEMRNLGETIYDALMEDISHDQACNACLPAVWHPGLISIGEIRYIGIYSEWVATLLQNYTPS